MLLCCSGRGGKREEPSMRLSVISLTDCRRRGDNEEEEPVGVLRVQTVAAHNTSQLKSAHDSDQARSRGVSWRIWLGQDKGRSTWRA